MEGPGNQGERIQNTDSLKKRGKSRDKEDNCRQKTHKGLPKLSKAAKEGDKKATETAVASFKENGQDFVMEISVPEDDEFPSDEES